MGLLRRRATTARYLSKAAARYLPARALWSISATADEQAVRTNLLLARPPGQPLPMTELRVMSQNGEDGVLWELFTHFRASPYRGTFIEIGANAQQSTALFLAQRAGWSGRFLDAGEPQIRGLRRAFAHRDDIACENTLLTAENLPTQLGPHLDSLDLLCIDVDGADSYFIEALPTAPRVLVTEINSTPGLHDFRQPNTHGWDRTVNFGTSIDIMDRICERKNLTRVYVESTGTNAFYVRNDLLERHPLPHHDHPYTIVANYYGLGLQHPGAAPTKAVSPATQTRTVRGNVSR